MLRIRPRMASLFLGSCWNCFDKDFGPYSAYVDVATCTNVIRQCTMDEAHHIFEMCQYRAAGVPRFSGSNKVDTKCEGCNRETWHDGVWDSEEQSLGRELRRASALCHAADSMLFQWMHPDDGVDRFPCACHSSKVTQPAVRCTGLSRSSFFRNTTQKHCGWNR